MAVRLCDSKKRSLEPYKRSYVSTEEFIVYGVDPGTYYIEVKNQSYYSLSAGVKKVKDFGGDSKKTAYQIAHKKRVSGLVTAGEKSRKCRLVQVQACEKQKSQDRAGSNRYRCISILSLRTGLQKWNMHGFPEK